MRLREPKIAGVVGSEASAPCDRERRRARHGQSPDWEAERGSEAHPDGFGKVRPAARLLQSDIGQLEIEQRRCQQRFTLDMRSECRTIGFPKRDGADNR